MNPTQWAERGWVPDPLIRIGIRRLLAQRLREVAHVDIEQTNAANRAFREECQQGPIALVPDLANEQHYEVPAQFYLKALGPHLKYSCALWEAGTETLSQAEERMLQLSCERAELEDGQTILDLGCGWGSLSLFMAEKYPNSRITSVSNSKSQREFILGQAEQRGLPHIDVITADINDFEASTRFDRVVSVEMFEHVRNHALLLQRIAQWLKPDGKLFVHHFSHRSANYPYETQGEDDWMGRHFFTGGMMPSDDMLLHYPEHMGVEDHWQVSGTHYQKTCEAWLSNQDAHQAELVPLFEDVYGPGQGGLWFQRWRMFFLACSELFGAAQGKEWFVTHLRLRPQEKAS